LAAVGCSDPEPDERQDRLVLPAPSGDGLEMVEAAAAALRRAGIGVSDLGLRRPTLDDVFLQLTGAPPSGNGAGPAATVASPAPALAPAPPPAPHRQLRLRAPSWTRLREATSDAAIVTGRNLRHFWRQPQLLIFSTGSRSCSVLFAYVFGGAIGGRCPRASPTSTSRSQALPVGRVPGDADRGRARRT
jgi:hypothetical protein